MWTHGSFFWNELNTRDPERAKAFYGDLLGWTFEAMSMPEGTYWVAKAGERAVGGIFTMSGPEFEGIPEHWFSYVSVDDLDARVARVGGAGGEVLRAPWDIPGIGRIAIVRDSNGAAIGWITPAPMGETGEAEGP